MNDSRSPVPTGATPIDPVPALELTAELVSIDSQNPGGSEERIAGRVGELATEFGFTVELIELAPGRTNVLIDIDAGGATTLMLSGHLDTKPIGDAASVWRSPPLELTVDGERAYGLGTSDMKAAVASMLLAARRWSTTATTGRLRLLFTADEEAGSVHGAQALTSAGLISSDAIIVGEPSGVDASWEAIYVVSRGICCFELVVEGIQGHSGLSERFGESATVAAARAAVALHDGLHPAAPITETVDAAPTVNVAVRLDGGVFYGVHPGRATVSCDIRVVPGMTRQRLDAEVREIVAGVIPSHLEWHIRYVDGSLGWMPPAAIAPDHRAVRVARRACAAVIGRELPLAAYPGGTDATYFVNHAGVPTIASLGPGLLSVAHGPNEYVPVADVDLAVDLYADIATRYFDDDFDDPAGT